jgi:hypothetical protein
MLASAVVAGGLARTAGSKSDGIAFAAPTNIQTEVTTASTAPTTLAANHNGVGWTVTNAQGQAIVGGTASSTFVGVQGNSKTSYGVVGTSVDIGAAGVQGTSTDGYGVYGLSASGPGVFGNSSNVGVSGLSVGNNGVNGQSTSGKGVYGKSTSGSGVEGFSSSSYGVAAYSSSSIAVFGSSTNFAVQGNTTGGIGVYGSATTGNAIYGVSTGGQAAQFDGAVLVNGSFTATGIKSAAVKDAAGELRRYYCLESPESFFEDFGRGQLSGGTATVNLETVFAQTVVTNDYFVFLTEVGSSSGLYVASQSSSGFVVSSAVAGSNATFNYRVVAHRAGVDAPRLQKVDGPTRVAGPDTSYLEHPPTPGPSPRIPDLPPSVQQPRSSQRD